MNMVLSVFKEKMPDYKKQLLTLGVSEKNADEFLKQIAQDIGMTSLVAGFFKGQEWTDRHNTEELQRPPHQRKFWRWF